MLVMNLIYLFSPHFSLTILKETYRVLEIAFGGISIVTNDNLLKLFKYIFHWLHSYGQLHCKQMVYININGNLLVFRNIN